MASLALILGGASCVPLASAGQSPAPLAEAPVAPLGLPPALAAARPPAPEPMVLQAVSPLDARAINAGIPIAAGPNPRPESIVFRAGTAWDQQRSLDCLAQAVYYEARSESEDGQRAVAQVVLNRVRHPAFPKSVCGVVYQGPNRAGGGCQFTFTCDGSLAAAPAGAAWERARRIAAEALAGSVYGPVGYATNYHTQDVVPVWAFKLVKSAVIGAHEFYRLPGAWGAPDAFRAAYAGREPSPSALLAARPAILPAAIQPAPLLQVAMAAHPVHPAPAEPSLAIAAPPLRDDRLPDTQVRDEYRTSGQWLAQPGEAGIH